MEHPVEKFILQEIPATQGPVYVCVTCQEQVTTFYRIKRTSLENLCHLNHYENILKTTSDVKFNDFKIIVDNNKIPVKREQDIDFKYNPNCKTLSDDENQLKKVIPDSKDPVFICATCLEEVSFFYTIKNESLQNCSRLKYFNALLKGSNNFQFNELNIIIESGELSTQRERLVEIKAELNHKYLFLSDEIHPTHIKKENEKYDHYSQQFENDNSNLNYLQDDESSSSSNDRTQINKNVGSYDVVDINKLPERDSNLTSNNSRHEDKPKTHEKKIFKCIECHKTFTFRSDLEIHSRVHTGEKPYKCTTCKKTFKRRYHLKIHTLTHTSKKSYECDVCHKSFKQKNHLTIHKQFHDNVHPYKCAVCRKAFIQSSDLTKHMRTHKGEKSDQCQTQRHSQEKKFKCTECHKSFTCRSKLEIHTRVHTGEKPFKCTICQKTFKHHSTLVSHKLIHTVEKPHECDVCHKTFNQKSNLISHKLIHTNVRPFQCAVCNKTFIQSSDLKTHMLTHTGEKPHQCHLCEYKCTRADALKTHIRSHTGEKPYSCKHCEKSFTSTSALKKHERRLHSNEDSK